MIHNEHMVCTEADSIMEDDDNNKENNQRIMFTWPTTCTKIFDGTKDTTVQHRNIKTPMEKDTRELLQIHKDHNHILFVQLQEIARQMGD